VGTPRKPTHKKTKADRVIEDRMTEAGTVAFAAGLSIARAFPSEAGPPSLECMLIAITQFVRGAMSGLPASVSESDADLFVLVAAACFIADTSGDPDALDEMIQSIREHETAEPANAPRKMH